MKPRHGQTNKHMSRLRKSIVIVSLLGLGFVCFMALANWWVIRSTTSLVFQESSTLPEREVGLVLGTSRVTAGGYANLHFETRMNAAAELFRSVKVRHLLVSGDNHRVGYDEPTDMKNALMARGVPADAITLDYAGFRTLDSVTRAKEVFGLSQVTIISDRFHNYRAVFLAQHAGLDAIAYCAKPVPLKFQTKSNIRESIARPKAVLDLYVLRKRPRFLGEKIQIQVSRD